MTVVYSSNVSDSVEVRQTNLDVACRTGSATFEATTATTVLTLPRGAIIRDFYVNITTASDATTAVFDVGLSTDPDGLVSDLDATTAGLSRAGDTSTVLGELNGTALAVDTAVQVTYSESSGTATEGTIEVVVLYTRQ